MKRMALAALAFGAGYMLAPRVSLEVEVAAGPDPHRLECLEGALRDALAVLPNQPEYAAHILALALRKHQEGGE